MPLIAPITYADGTILHLWRVTESCDELCSLCAKRGIDVGECLDFKAESRKTEYMVERILLDEAVGKPVKLLHDANGAPHIDEIGNISISHTVGLVGVAVNENHAIGIDIEHKAARVLRVRNKFLDDEEIGKIASDDVDANLVAWTAKEAMYKLVPMAGISMRDNLHIELPENGLCGAELEYAGSAYYGNTRLGIRLTTCVMDADVITFATMNGDF